MVVKKRSDAIDMVKGLSIMTLFYLHFEEGWMNTDLNYFIVRSPAFYIVCRLPYGTSCGGFVSTYVHHFHGNCLH